jgi:hypothetical protein
MGARLKMTSKDGRAHGMPTAGVSTQVNHQKAVEQVLRLRRPVSYMRHTPGFSAPKRKVGVRRPLSLCEEGVIRLFFWFLSSGKQTVQEEFIQTPLVYQISRRYVMLCFCSRKLGSTECSLTRVLPPT